MSFAWNICKNTSKIFSSKYSQMANCDLIANKNAVKIKRVSKPSPQNNLLTNEEEILRERCISSEEIQKIIDDLKSI